MRKRFHFFDQFNRYGLRVALALNDLVLGLWMMLAIQFYTWGIINLILGIGIVIFFYIENFKWRTVVAFGNLVSWWGVAGFFMATEPMRYIGYTSLLDAIICSLMFMKLIFDKEVSKSY